MHRRFAPVHFLLVVSGGLFFLPGTAHLAQAFGDPLRAELDRHWPAVSAEQQRQTAINYAVAGLKVLPAANVAAGADTASIQAIAFDQVKSKGVTKLDITTDRQLLKVTADFDITLKPEDLPQDATTQRSLVAALTPHVKGQVELYLTAAASLAKSPQRTLQIKLLPALSRVQVYDVTVAGHYDIPAAGNVIALLLNRYADSLSSVLSGSPLLNVTLPATLQDDFDPSGPIKVDLKEAPDLKLSITGHPIKSPFGLGAAAWLIDGEKLIVIVDVAPLDKLPSQPAPTKASFDSLKADFDKSLNVGIGAPASGSQSRRRCSRKASTLRFSRLSRV